MENPPKVNRAVGLKIKEMIMKEDPKFLESHSARFDEFLPETATHTGGYKFTIAGKCWVGYVVIKQQNHTFGSVQWLEMEFGRFPKNTEGKNEWKVDHSKMAMTPSNLIAILRLIDNESFKVAGGIEKKRNKFNHFTRVSKKSI